MEAGAASTEPLTKTETSQPGSSGITSTSPETPPAADSPQLPVISQITTLESGLSSASFSGDNGFVPFWPKEAPPQTRM